MGYQRSISFGFAFMVAACAPWDAPLPEAGSHYVATETTRTPAIRSPLDPVAPMRLGDAPVDAGQAEREAMWWVNTYRTRAGLGPVHQLSDLNEAARAHARYVLLNPDLYDDLGMSVHEEAPERMGFFAERFWERMKAAGYVGLPFREVIAYQAKPAAAVAHWMETVYHRLPLLHPAAQHLGYAEAQLGKSRINVLDVGAGDGDAPEIPDGIVWPPDGATNVALSWDGLESPKPPAPPNGYPSGPVITMTFGRDTAFEVLEHQFLELDVESAVDTEVPLPHTLLTPSNDVNLEGESSVALYSDNPLAPATTYEVRLRGIADGVEFFRAWSFTTRASDSCSLVAQDCGVGRACYGTSETHGICAWAGARVEGDACDYQNDCDSGMTCVGSVCRRYCTLELSALECQASCEPGYSTIDKAGGVGVCRL
ncbi:MAG: hypothetical protein ACI9WU_001192 [Myxococcota bacterium]|jgi:uncharacterized protein YkwD